MFIDRAVHIITPDNAPQEDILFLDGDLKAALAKASTLYKTGERRIIAYSGLTEYFKTHATPQQAFDDHHITSEIFRATPHRQDIWSYPMPHFDEFVRQDTPSPHEKLFLGQHFRTSNTIRGLGTFFFKLDIENPRMFHKVARQFNNGSDIQTVEQHAQFIKGPYSFAPGILAFIMPSHQGHFEGATLHSAPYSQDKPARSLRIISNIRSAEL